MIRDCMLLHLHVFEALALMIPLDAFVDGQSDVVIASFVEFPYMSLSKSHLTGYLLYTRRNPTDWLSDKRRVLRRIKGPKLVMLSILIPSRSPLRISQDNL